MTGIHAIVGSVSFQRLDRGTQLLEASESMVYVVGDKFQPALRAVRSYYTQRDREGEPRAWGTHVVFATWGIDWLVAEGAETINVMRVRFYTMALASLPTGFVLRTSEDSRQQWSAHQVKGGLVVPCLYATRPRIILVCRCQALRRVRF